MAKIALKAATNLPFEILEEITLDFAPQPNIGYITGTENFPMLLKFRVSSVVVPLRIDKGGEAEQGTAFLELIGLDRNIQKMAEHWMVAEHSGIVPGSVESVEAAATKIHMSVSEHTQDSLAVSGLLPFYHLFFGVNIEETKVVVKAVCSAFATLADANGNYVDESGNRVASPVPEGDGLLE